MKLMLKWGLLAAVLTMFVGSTPAYALPTVALAPASKCLAGKYKCVIKKKSCLLGCYKKGLGKDLPVHIRSIVERQYQGVIANHDRVRDLRDRYRATA